MDDAPKPAFRIDHEGNRRSMDTPYEQGRYAWCVGDTLVDNPHDREDKMNRRLWEKGFNEARDSAQWRKK